MSKIFNTLLVLFLLSFSGVLHAQKVERVKSSGILIAYYSWGGNTKAMAQMIQKISGGTLFEIQCVKPYPKDFKACVAAAKKDIKTGTQMQANIHTCASAGY